MKAYKCDICGGLYEHREYLKINEVKHFIAKEKEYTFKDEFNTGRPFLADICHNCISAIQEVIDERSKK